MTVKGWDYPGATNAARRLAEAMTAEIAQCGLEEQFQAEPAVDFEVHDGWHPLVILRCAWPSGTLPEIIDDMDHLRLALSGPVSFDVSGPLK